MAGGRRMIGSTSSSFPEVIPHITVWGSCFSLGSRRGTASSSAASSFTHSLTHARTHSLTHSLPQAGRRSTESFLAAFCVAGAKHRASSSSWPAVAFCVAGAVHRASWRSCGARGRPRLPFAWQAQYTEVPGGCLLRGRRSTQSFLEELRRAWPPLACGWLPFAWQARVVTSYHIILLVSRLIALQTHPFLSLSPSSLSLSLSLSLFLSWFRCVMVLCWCCNYFGFGLFRFRSALS